MASSGYAPYRPVMTKGQFTLVTGLILLVAWARWHAAGLILGGLGVFAAYYISLRVHPRTRHTGWRGCGGTGEHKGVVFGWGHRKCPGCQSGRLVRRGAGQWGAPRVQQEYRKGKAARKKAKQENRWR